VAIQQVYSVRHCTAAERCVVVVVIVSQRQTKKEKGQQKHIYEHIYTYTNITFAAWATRKGRYAVAEPGPDICQGQCLRTVVNATSCQSSGVVREQ
jgi:hypothetical protein